MIPSLFLFLSERFDDGLTQMHITGTQLPKGIKHSMVHTAGPLCLGKFYTCKFSQS